MNYTLHNEQLETYNEIPEPKVNTYDSFKYDDEQVKLQNAITSRRNEDNKTKNTSNTHDFGEVGV